MADADRAADFSFVPYIRPGDRVMVGQGTAEPQTLLRRLLEQARAGELPAFTLFLGPVFSDSLSGGVPNSVSVESYGAIGATRGLMREGRLDIFPTHLSSLNRDILSGLIRVDVVLLPLRPAITGAGWNLGIARDIAFAATHRARAVIGELQPNQPQTFGGDVRDLVVDAMVQAEGGPVELPVTRPDDVSLQIAAHVAPLAPDGAVLQTGVGGIPAAVCAAFRDHRDIGVHSGAVPDEIVDLVERGVVTNARKEVDAGVSVTGMLLGGRRLYDFAHRNQVFRLAGHETTHAHRSLSQLSRLFAVNSALEVDLTGQVGAEVANGRYLGAVGGQVDFVRGAQASPGGRSVIALPSRTAQGDSRIVLRAGIVTCGRADADTFVTEHGVAELRGQPVSERVKRMIAIAAPEHQEALARTWRDTGMALK
ncbi:acetyl-CoA hydrolase/transferase C-terminal domain-containing protein [Pseudooceanicola sp.]|uniref:acetyl-CoA hydrolase/transferase family protein n=1 Tax=Pseudooceanicola sp. TaxID=1914328 RepID=UPI002613DB1D|nr:acetyl-CoA hydrolase/transferase C-terminal domain-containing protein [Pseudooceanicola sp.]MDF1855090.1 acetyl-CoA hydrolase/transferase C-terminal domain-containing protein [Pseudooceanicola sp.]